MLVSVEGNIGAGKSTLLAALASRGLDVVQEPIEAWTDCHGVNLLAAFYAEPKRYAYVFQSVAFLSRLNALDAVGTRDAGLVFAERSPVSDYCFARNCYESGMLDECEWAAYRYWWTRPMRMPDLVVYLRASPETCFERTQKRKRPEEAGVSLEYLQAIHDQHERCLLQGDSPAGQLPCLVVDANVHSDAGALVEEVLKRTSAGRTCPPA